MKVSKMADSILPSRGRQLFNLASEYDDVIDLTLGDPDIIPPQSIREAGSRAIMEGKTRYSANAGVTQLRIAYSNYIEDKYKREFEPKSQVIVTVGGMEALYLAIISAINPGDEVIIFEPYYINYYQMIQMSGGIPIPVKTDEANNFIPELDSVEKKICEKTKMIIMNSPANPTGAIWGQSTVEGIIQIAKKDNILLISDEVYSTLVYNDARHFSVLEAEPFYENIMFIDSCSKKFSMTGWRVGFAIGPKEWIAAMTKLQENVAACAPLPSQYAALEAFNNLPDMSGYVQTFQERRDVLVARLSKSNLLSFHVPEATFYLFVNISRTGMNSMDFAINLLREKHIAVVPGIAYGDNFDNYIRIAFTIDVKELIRAADGIVSFVKEKVFKSPF